MECCEGDSVECCEGDRVECCEGDSVEYEGDCVDVKVTVWNVKVTHIGML